jgi:hypothetical protein
VLLLQQLKIIPLVLEAVMGLGSCTATAVRCMVGTLVKPHAPASSQLCFCVGRRQKCSSMLLMNVYGIWKVAREYGVV